MMKRILVIVLIIVISIISFGCDNKMVSKEEKTINNLIKLDGTKIGNASDVGSIIRNLPGNEYFKEMSLETSSKPYGLTINYGIDDSLGEASYINYWNDEKEKDIIVKNITYLFILIDNLDKVTVNLNLPIESSFTIDRYNIEDVYNIDLKDYKIKDCDSSDLITTERIEAIWNKLNS